MFQQNSNERGTAYWANQHRIAREGERDSRRDPEHDKVVVNYYRARKWSYQDCLEVLLTTMCRADAVALLEPHKEEVETKAAEPAAATEAPEAPVTPTMVVAESLPLATPLPKTPREVALIHAKFGYKIFLCNPDHSANKCEKNHGGDCSAKTPLARLCPNGHLNATNDLNKINQWFDSCDKTSIKPNLAIFCKASGLVVFDKDRHKPDADGVANFEKLKGKNKYGDVCIHFTPNDGQHIIYANPDSLEFPKQIEIEGLADSGIDIKHNGYILIPPSTVHGKLYKGLDDFSLLDKRPGALPDWLLQFAKPKITLAKSEVIKPAPRPVSHAEREHAPLALGFIPLDCDYDTYINCGIAIHAGDLPFEVWDKYFSKSPKYKAGYGEKKWASFTKPEERTARRSITLRWLFFEARKHGYKFPPEFFSRNDIGNARRLAMYFGHELCWLRAEKSWYVWDGKVWKSDNNEKPLFYAKQIATQLFAEAVSTEDFKWCARSSEVSKLKAMLEVAKDELAITADCFDNNPYLFNCANGILDLKQRKLLPHAPEYFLTQLTPVAYVPDAKAPRFMQFLSEIFADANTEDE